jgi:hypothetical protein
MVMRMLFAMLDNRLIKTVFDETTCSPPPVMIQGNPSGGASDNTETLPPTRQLEYLILNQPP